MAKDYAKYTIKSSRKQLVAHGWRSRLLLVIFLFFILCLLSLGGYLYKNHQTLFPKLTLTAWITNVKSFLAHKKSEQESALEMAKTETPIVVKPEPEVQFHFYADLANMQVTLPEVESPPKIMQSRVAKENKLGQKRQYERQYVIQMGTFQSEATAAEIRISLLLAGFEAELVRSLQGGKLIFLLQQGPYRGLAEAKGIQAKLKKKGFESNILTLK